jgi:hypothetical protein
LQCSPYPSLARPLALVRAFSPVTLLLVELSVTVPCAPKQRDGGSIRNILEILALCRVGSVEFIAERFDPTEQFVKSNYMLTALGPTSLGLGARA